VLAVRQKMQLMLNLLTQCDNNFFYSKGNIRSQLEVSFSKSSLYVPSLHALQLGNYRKCMNYWLAYVEEHKQKRVVKCLFGSLCICYLISDSETMVCEEVDTDDP